MSLPIPPTAAPYPAAVLWDFDGTLADTEPVWVACEYELVGGLGGTWNHHHAQQLVGNALIDSGRYIVDLLGRPDLTPEWVVEQLVTRVARSLGTQPIPWRPGALDLLRSLAEAAVPCALVSASYRVLLDAALGQLPEGSFATSVAGDEVANGKPHPEPYETAARLLDVDVSSCVVIEDSPTGATAGNAAGAFVLAVPHFVPVPAAPRRVQVTSLTELDAPRVAQLLAAADG